MNRTLFYIRLFFFLLFVPGLPRAQKLITISELERKGGYLSRLETTIGERRLYRVSTGFEASAVVVEVGRSQDLTGAYILSGTDTLHLRKDEHATERPGVPKANLTNLIVFRDPVKKFDFYPSGLQGKVVFNLLNAGSFKDTELNVRTSGKHKEDCEEPQSIDQEIWRKGLPEPKYNRLFTEVNHLIIHHSASSNSNTNYTELVRNIYLYHTEVNGWSDIGYNYLIAPDGTIFKGRDPGNGSQDNVLGAHFCGNNSNTMGICLLGTFTDISPTEEAVSSLVTLLNWKSIKNNLNPLGNISHQTNYRLNVIAGHRDGCATICPGDKLYDMLTDIRDETQGNMVACGMSKSITRLKIYPVPAETFLMIEYENAERLSEVNIFNMHGKRLSSRVQKYSNKQVRLDTRTLSPGLYLLRINEEGTWRDRKFIVR